MTAKQAPSVTAKLNVKIFSPAQTYYQGAASSVSAQNKVGPFDILADHANFFSLVTAGQIKINTGFSQLAFTIARGIITVRDNHVTVFMDI